MRYLFVHPVLGIGGAEKLVVDLAYNLNRSKDNTVHVATNEYNPGYCFDECHTLQIKSFGWHSEFDRASQIVSATINSLLMCLLLIMGGASQGTSILSYDIIFVDIIAVPALVFKLYFQLIKLVDFFNFSRGSSRQFPQIIFYCHFPDALLARPKSVIHSSFRIPFDLLEQFYMFFADSIIFNSQFTLSAYEKSCFFLDKIYPKHKLYVMYPPIPKATGMSNIPDDLVLPKCLSSFILSLNRFDAKKSLGRALYLCQFLKSRQQMLPFVIAGGFDPKNAENNRVLSDLKLLAKKLDLSYVENLDAVSSSTDIVFLKGVSSALKAKLMASAKALFYTPSYEHFGIIPLETMQHGNAVVFAMGSGGPAEYIRHKETGYLIPDRHQDNINFLEALSEEETEDLIQMLSDTIKDAQSKKIMDMKSQAQHCASTNFDVDSAIFQLSQIFEDNRRQKPSRQLVFSLVLVSCLGFYLKSAIKY